MGTWDTGILGNDTSREVEEVFLARYDEGADVDAVVAEIRERFATSLGLAEDRTNVELALALVRWEVGALDADTLAHVRAIVADGSDIAAWRALGASESQLRDRAKVLAKLVAKLAVAKPRPRARKPRPVPLDTPFVAGACLALRHPPAEHTGLVVIESALFPRKGYLLLAATTLELERPPTFADFEAARLVGFAWEDVYGQAARCASPNGKTGRIHVVGLGYESAREGALLRERLQTLFEVVGRFPRFTQVLLATTGTDSIAEPDPAPAIAALVARRHRAHLSTSAEPLRVLSSLLSTPRRATEAESP